MGEIPPARFFFFFFFFFYFEEFFNEREFFTLTKLCKSSLVLFGGYLCVETEMDTY